MLNAPTGAQPSTLQQACAARPLPTCTSFTCAALVLVTPALTGCRAPHLPADSMTLGPLSAAPALASQMAMFPMTKKLLASTLGTSDFLGEEVPLSILQTPKAEGLLAAPLGEVHVHRAGGERQPGRRLGHRIYCLSLAV